MNKQNVTLFLNHHHDIILMHLHVFSWARIIMLILHMYYSTMRKHVSYCLLIDLATGGQVLITGVKAYMMVPIVKIL